MAAVQIIFRHLSGSRATMIDVVPLGAHRELILGRALSAAVRFDPHDDRAVGRQHARITRTAHQLVLADLDSRNGTLLNGTRLTTGAELHSGDVVQLGEGGPMVEVTIEG